MISSAKVKSNSTKICCYLIVTISVFLSNSVMAQTRFNVSQKKTDVSTYRHPEECIAAVERSAKTHKNNLKVWSDTAKLLHSELLDSLPASVVAEANRCVTTLKLNTLRELEYVNWIRAYLEADREQDAQEVLRRQLEIVSSKPLEDKIRVFINVRGAFESVRPVSLSVLSDLADSVIKNLPDTALEQLIKIHMSQMHLAINARDSSYLHKEANRSLSFLNSLTPEQRSKEQYHGLKTSLANSAMQFLAEAEILDSLKKGTQAFLSLKRLLFTKAGARIDDKLPYAVGEKAAPIQGDFWFTHKSIHNSQSSIANYDLSKPSSGRVNLIVFLTGGCHVNVLPSGIAMRETNKSTCWDIYSSIKRLKEKYPEIDITIVASTFGSLATTDPIPPEAEASLLSDLWLKHHDLKATLSVSSTEFFKLSDPDRRRIDMSIENVKNYTFPGVNIQPKVSFLVSPEGIIVHSAILTRSSERDFERLIDAMIR